MDGDTIKKPLFLTTVLLLWTIRAFSQSALPTFDIPHGNLSKALLLFAEQSNSSVLLDATAIANRETLPLAGTMSPEQALTELLRGTGLTFQLLNGKTYIISSTPQETEQAPTDIIVEEVLVTSLRQTENLQKVPLAVSVISESVLQQDSLLNLASVSTRVPGLTVTSFSLGQPNIHMRGIGSNDDGAAMDNSVVLFVDDIYVGRISTMDLSLLDLARVEVIRGPQGSLYGRNAIGGAIRLISNPADDKQRGLLKLSGGNFDHYAASTLLNGPLNADKTLTGRFFTDARRQEGWQRNLISGAKQHGTTHWNSRLQMRWQPNEQREFNWSFDASRDNLASTGRIPIRGRTPLALLDENGQRIPLNDGSGGVVTALPTAIFSSLGGDPKHATNGTQGYSDRNIWGISQRVTSRWDNLELLSISAYRDSLFQWLEDSIGLPSFVTDQVISAQVDERHRQFSQEFRLSNAHDRFSSILGLYFLYENTARVEQFPFLTTTAITDQTNQTHSYAIYGEAIWQPAPTLTLSVGGRLTHDRKALEQQSSNGGAPAIILQDFQLKTQAKWNDFSPRVSVAFDATDELLIYSSISRGVKSGGFQGAPGTKAIAEKRIEPELAWSYELGIKAQWFNQRLTTNVAAFYIDYRDLQVVQFQTVDSFGLFKTSNAASASVRGVELEAAYIVGQNLSFTGNYGFLRATYDRFNDLEGRDFTGNTLRQAPKHSLNVGIQYQYPLLNANIRLRADYHYQSESFREPDNNITRLPSYQLINANLSYLPHSSRWEATLWGKNLSDKRYLAHLYVLGGNDYALFGAPRSFGISFTWHYL